MKLIVEIRKNAYKIFCTFVFPIVMWCFFAILIQGVKGDNIFISLTSFEDIMQTSVMSFIVAIAVALPLSGGRWDFAPGTIIVLSGILAGNIAVNNDMGLIGLILLSLGIAMVLALFEGILYIAFKVPTMIISLGIVMLYEALSGIVYDGSGIRLYMYEDLSILARRPYCYFIMLFVLIMFWFIMKYTKFGYDSRSLGSHALLAVNNGVKEKKNILLTYVVVGFLLGIASILNASKAVVVPAMNLSSTSIMFSSMGAVLVGLFLAKYSNMAMGILSGTIAMEVFAKGLVVLGTPNSLKNIIMGSFIILFMGITINGDKIKHMLINYKHMLFHKSKETI